MDVEDALASAEDLDVGANEDLDEDEGDGEGDAEPLFADDLDDPPLAPPMPSLSQIRSQNRVSPCLAVPGREGRRDDEWSIVCIVYWRWRSNSRE
jgi:hypothetical protein